MNLCLRFETSFGYLVLALFVTGAVFEFAAGRLVAGGVFAYCAIMFSLLVIRR